MKELLLFANLSGVFGRVGVFLWCDEKCICAIETCLRLKADKGISKPLFLPVEFQQQLFSIGLINKLHNAKTHSRNITHAVIMRQINQPLTGNIGSPSAWGFN